jgi:hypothetical protein
VPLSVLDRLLLLGLLVPKSNGPGNLMTLRIMRTLCEDLSFSEQDHANFKLTQDDKKISWDHATETDKAVEIGPKAKEIILSAMAEASKAEALTGQHVDLCDKFGFVEPEE